MTRLNVVIPSPEMAGYMIAWSAELPIQETATDVARFASPRAHYHADVIYLFP